MSWNKHEEAERANQAMKAAFAACIDQQMTEAFQKGYKRGCDDGKSLLRAKLDEIKAAVEALPIGFGRAEVLAILARLR